jgi:hypothetical protein
MENQGHNEAVCLSIKAKKSRAVYNISGPACVESMASVLLGPVLSADRPDGPSSLGQGVAGLGVGSGGAKQTDLYNRLTGNLI